MAQVAHTNLSNSRILPLKDGEILTRQEFERRFDATPGLKLAELIEGRVYMSPPVFIQDHGSPHAFSITILGIYCATTPGVVLADNSSLRVDDANMPQPDVFLAIERASGGQSRIDEEGYLEGVPELIIEIAASSVERDLGEKLRL